jgi:ribosomal protein S18 acetylase RimI-like enzyme
MTFELGPAHDVSLIEQATILNKAFAGYLAGWSEMDTAAVARFICAQGADLCYSRFVRTNGALAGFGYINRAGNITRLAAMGTVPEARRTGAASFLLLHLLNEAKARGDEAMILEVFEQNLPAVALYRRNGFSELTRLFGWRRHKESETAPEAEEVSLLSASQKRSAYEYPDIPWQISQHAVAKLSIARAYKIDNVHVVIGDPDVDPVRVHGLFWNQPDDWDAPRNALDAVLHQFSKREFFAPAIFPERFGVEIFQPLGFVRAPLNQLLMRHNL